MRIIRLVLVIAVVAGLLAPTSALAQSAPDAGTAWAPKPKSQPLYGT